MRHSTNHNGFTLLEVMMTIALIGIIASPVLSSQFSILRLTNDAAALAIRFLRIDNLFVEPKDSVTIDDPFMTITRTLAKPPEQSWSKIESLKLVRVAASWPDDHGGRTDTWVSFEHVAAPKEQS